MSGYREYTDRELVGLMGSDDQHAFTELYNRHWKSLFYTADAILRQKETSSDIVQEVFASLWQRRRVVVIEFPKTYLHQAVRFQVFKAINAEKTARDFYQRLAGV